MDAVLMDVDASQVLFENAIAAVDETIAALGSQVGLDRRTAKMRDMRDSLRARLATQTALHGQPVATT